MVNLASTRRLRTVEAHLLLQPAAAAATPTREDAGGSGVLRLNPDGMIYRRLGASGLQCSVLGAGSLGGCKDQATADALVTEYLNHGINFFDSAEGYGNGIAESLLGQALTNLKVPRNDIVISTKVFKGAHANGPNDTGLSRKHLLEGTRACLERLQLEYVDVIIAHRPDFATPMEEIVRGFNMLLDMHLALYWGTSRWSMQMITEAWAVADRLGLVGPVVDQGPYSIAGKDDGGLRPWPFDHPARGDGRQRVERDAQPLIKDFGLGLTTFSPLGGGILAGTRETKSGGPLTQGLQEVAEIADGLAPIADSLGCTVAQLGLAWCCKNEDVTTVIFGTSTPSRVAEQVEALKVLPMLTPDVMDQIDEVAGTAPPGQHLFR